jgi:carbonic anhydrase
MECKFNGVMVAILAAGLAIFSVPCIGADTAGWSYAGPSGPAKWGKLGKEFALCASGELQSPIDIPDANVRKGDLPALLFNYKPSPLRIVDDGHTVQVNYAPDSWVTVNGKRYQLVAITFHKPSEETVNGKGHEMSAHLVHKDKDGKVGIIAVPFDVGAENPVLKTIWSNLPSGRGKESVIDSVTINALGLLPKNKGYYTYAGSLTAPPCTEGVTWFVMQVPVTVSAEQIARFGRLYPMNARPTQPRNDRDILGSP